MRGDANSTSSASRTAAAISPEKCVSSWMVRPESADAEIGDRMDDQQETLAGEDEHGPDLDHHERHHSGSGPTPPDARIIHELIREDGEKTLVRSVRAMAWSA